MEPEQYSIPLLPHQEQGKQFILSHPYCGLFLDMGLGKTLTTLAALYDINPTGHVLVIAPKNIARSTWLDEIDKWQIPIRWKSLIVNEKGKDLSKAKRLALYDSIKDAPPTVWFINRELLCDLIKYMTEKAKEEKDFFINPRTNKKEPKWYFPYIVIDEFQSFKSYSSQRFKALKTVRPQIERLIGLTGTHAPNGIEDLWAELYLLDEGYRLGPTITSFRNAFMYSTFVVNGHSVGWQPIPGAEETIYERIKDVVISLKNTTMHIPDVTYSYIKCYMNDKERSLYRQLAKTYVLNIAGKDITVANAAVLQGKLSQMASGALYIDDDKNYTVIHKHKLEQAEYIVNNTSDNIMIAYHFKSDKDMLLKYFEEIGIPCEAFDGTKPMIDRWNNKQIRVMLIQPASAGHGLNLQFGGHTLIWYTMPWSLEEYLQCNARLHRQGQTDPVIIHHLICDKTYDEVIRKALERKDITQQALIDAVDRTVSALSEETADI